MNVESSTNDADENFANENRGLMRFEFLEALVRIAVCKYKEEANGDVSDSLVLLMTRHVEPHFIRKGLIKDPALESETGKVPLSGRASQNLFSDPNVWRHHTLYDREVDVCLKSHHKLLDMLFQHYSMFEETTRDGVTVKSRTPQFTLSSWFRLLDESRMLVTVHNKPPWGHLLSQRDARLAFYACRFTVVDEVKHRNRLTSLDRLEFFEIICRYW